MPVETPTRLKHWIPFRASEEKNGRRMVWGYASTETPGASTGISVTNAAIRKVTPGWLEFGNIREMHGMSAAGNVKPDDAAIDEKGLFIGAQIDDDQAWKKVLGGTYKGFSIGIDYLPSKLKAAAGSDKKTIIDEEAAHAMPEISICDRPEVPDTLIERVEAVRFSAAAATADRAALLASAAFASWLTTAGRSAPTTEDDTIATLAAYRAHEARSAEGDRMKDSLLKLLNRALYHAGWVMDHVAGLHEMAKQAQGVADDAKTSNDPKAGDHQKTADHLHEMTAALGGMAAKHLAHELGALKASVSKEDASDEDVKKAEECITAMENAAKGGATIEGVKALKLAIESTATMFRAAINPEESAKLLARCTAAEGKIETLEAAAKAHVGQLAEKDKTITELRSKVAVGGGKFSTTGKESDVITELTGDQTAAVAERVKELKAAVARGGAPGHAAALELTRLKFAGANVN